MVGLPSFRSVTESFTRETAKMGGPGAQVIAEIGICAAGPTQCFFNIANFMTYAIPKTTLESTASFAFWGSKKLYNLATSFISNPDDALKASEKPGLLAKIYEAGAEKAVNLSLQSTSWMTGKSIEVLNAETLEFNKLNDLASAHPELLEVPVAPFKAIDLIGPGLLLGVCTHKAKANLSEALFHAKMLVTGQRLASTMYKSPIENCEMVGSCEIGVSKTKRYTTPGLIKDVFMETVFTGLWSAGAYLTYDSIYNAVNEASGNSEKAALVAQAVLIAGVVGPTVLGWLKAAVTPYSSPSQLSPSSTNQYAYIDERPITTTRQVGIHADTRNLTAGLLDSTEQLTAAEAAARLMRYRQISPEDMV